MHPDPKATTHDMEQGEYAILCAYTCIHMYMYIYIHICVYIYICIYIYISVFCMYACMYVMFLGLFENFTTDY